MMDGMGTIAFSDWSDSGIWSIILCLDWKDVSALSIQLDNRFKNLHVYQTADISAFYNLFQSFSQNNLNKYN